MMTDETAQVTPADVAQRINQPDLEARLAAAEAARIDAELRALRAETAIRFGLDDEDRDVLLTGKVYRGADALKYGLVDKVGSLQDAVNHAAKLTQTGSGKSASSFTQNFTSALWHNTPKS